MPEAGQTYPSMAEVQKGGRKGAARGGEERKGGRSRRGKGGCASRRVGRAADLTQDTIEHGNAADEVLESGGWQVRVGGGGVRIVEFR